MERERLLLVEDERIIALDLQRRLERFGYQVIGIAAKGQEALEKAEAEKPDIILMDIMLSGDMDGIEAASIIKERFQIPVIFLTAYSEEKTLERAKEAEPFGYIIKPFKDRELYTTIDIAIYKYKIDQQLKRQERLSSAILHSIEDGIIATDINGKVAFMNPVAEKITGWSEKDVKQKHIDKILNLKHATDRTTITIPSLHQSSEGGAPYMFKEVILENRKGDLINIEGSVAAIRDRNNNLEGQVFALRDTTAMKRLSETIDYQANHDNLTGLVNRDRFNSRLEQLIVEVASIPMEHAFIYIDLDQFKVINDTCGHAAGDEMLLQATQIIKNVVRSSDVCGRLGGDEFGIILENASRDHALEIAKRLHERLRNTRIIWDQNIFSIKSSMGIVVINDKTESLGNVLAAADDACYIAKDTGGNKIQVYEDTSNIFQKRRGEMEWISKITHALEENRFILYYQPIVPLNPDITTAKCEILVRMKDSDGQIIMPADFIPAAERYNLMPSIDRWIIRNAIHSYPTFLSNGGKDQNISTFTINLSAHSLADENLSHYIKHQIEDTGVSAQSFCFELTETATITNMATATKFITEMKSFGCTFALDDFGSGFSSFNYLKTLPVDFLKIDGTFVKDMDVDSVNRAMVESINTMGHIMGIKTIAEFVSNAEVKQRLIELGIDYGQGYEIAKPVPLLHET
ncbi:MAG: EAL domain-containing protein [Spirochaetales bacterium]|nr:EAL domain-containing protein [Spirochaetales bacterium]